MPFAGYSMPVQYAGGIVHEHRHTRENAGLFDVSHMGQLVIDASVTALETLVPGDLSALGEFEQRYTILTNTAGGIIDDLMFTRMPDHWSVVVNAAFKDADVAHLRTALAGVGSVALLQDRALLALQGPRAAAVLSAYCPQAGSLDFMAALVGEVAGVECVVNRCGYTGEDGFEVACAAGDAERLARALLTHEHVEAIGLGARDSLRLEAGLCLSGTDIDATTTPVEAALGWLVARKYRGQNPAPALFPGAEIILRQLPDRSARVRIGLKPNGRVPLRGDTLLTDEHGAQVGRITSGTYGASVGHPVAMGYVDRAFARPGTSLLVSIRGRTHSVEVAALPFIAHRYYKP